MQGKRIDGASLLKEANIEEAEQELNFSSELEIDDRFETAEQQLNEAENNVIDRSAPQGLRKRAQQMR